jgi:ABC-type phosphate transport system substrate-binding protein
VGGADCAIALINRSEGSGVRSLVEERVLSNLSVAQAGRHAASNREAALAVQSTRGGFSYVALPAARDLDILAFAVDDVPPSNQHVLTGMYPFWTCARVLMRREMQDFVLRFTDHIALGSDVCQSLGYISLSRMESLNLHHVRRITR